MVDEKRITEIKWRAPSSSLYRDKRDSGLPPMELLYEKTRTSFLLKR